MDAWFLALYRTLAEPMATTDGMVQLNPDEEMNMIWDCQEHPLWALAINVDGIRVVPKRYLNPGTPETLWHQYELDMVDNPDMTQGLG